MKTRLAEWLGKARRLEAAIESRVEGASGRLAPAAREPLEIVHAIVTAVAAEVQAAGRGQHVFPYTQVRISLAAASARERARLAAACDGPPTLPQRILERLTAAGCHVESLSVKVAFAAEPKAEWVDPAFHVDFARAAAPAQAPVPPRIDLAVVRGAAERSSYVFTGTAIAIGRGSEVRDSRDRLMRTNHVAFLEHGEDVNRSVSRQHARIEYDAASGSYRLHDDKSSRGTSVIREGRGLPVPGGRGLRLRSGDILVLGEARIRVKLPEA